MAVTCAQWISGLIGNTVTIIAKDGAAITPAKASINIAVSETTAFEKKRKRIK